MNSVPASHRDLLSQPGIASLSTVGPGGVPQVTALWFLAEGEVVRTSLMKSRQKYKNMVSHPFATLFVIDPQNQGRTLEIRGEASFEEDPDLAFFERIIRHYGADPDTFTGREDRVILTLTPTRVVTMG
jgi:PPOX class probable F420-dependent enzyme